MRVLKSLQIESRFSIVHSAEEEEHGKPHPAVFMKAAKKLGFDPSNCLAIEDSVNGVISAKAARMSVIAVPDESIYDDPRFALADLKVPVLEDALPLIERFYKA